MDGLNANVGYNGMAVPRVPGLQLALAVAACAYLLNSQKRTEIPKAIGAALGAFLLGGLIGNGLEAWLRVDLVPLGPVSNPATIVGEASIIATWILTVLIA